MAQKKKEEKSTGFINFKTQEARSCVMCKSLERSLPPARVISEILSEAIFPISKKKKKWWWKRVVGEGMKNEARENRSIFNFLRRRYVQALISGKLEKMTPGIASSGPVHIWPLDPCEDPRSRPALPH